jgi:Secretion system C-terminal sorting domain
MKHLSLFACCFLAFSQLLHSQICNPAGNIAIYSNYDGGVLNINCDQNIPNLKIGIVTYEPTTINITGAFVGNVTEVRYAGYVSTNNNHCSNSPTTTTITGVSSGITSVNFLPASTLNNPNGYTMIVCNYSCDINSNQGGCNTADQVVDYFETTMGGTMRYHLTQYGCFSSTPYLMSAGGNCCAGGGGGCTLAVNAGSDVSVCPGTSVQLGSNCNGTCTWSPSAGLSNPNICNPLASPSVTTTYTVSCDSAGCLGTDDITITVDPVPSVSCNGPATVCNNASPLLLNFCTPAGGVYSGANVASGMFDPSGLSGGNYNVTYTATNAFGCSSDGILSVTVLEAPVVGISAIDSLCEADNAITLIGTPSGGTFSGSGVSINTFDPSVAGTGDHTITYSYTDGANGCIGSASTIIHVTATPSAPVLTFTPPTSLTSTIGDTYQWFLNGTPVGTGGPNFTAPSPGTYWVVVTDNGCISDTSNHVIVLPNALIDEVNGMVAKLFPNPTSGIFTIEFPNTMHLLEVNVYDVEGKKLLTRFPDATLASLSVDISSLSAGNYFIAVHTDSGIFTGKVIKK